MINRSPQTNGFPADFVDLTWGQWLGRGTNRAFRRGADAIVLVTAELPSGVKSDWSALLGEILQTTPERILSRMNSGTGDGSQASRLQRAMLSSFTAMISVGPTGIARCLSTISARSTATWGATQSGSVSFQAD